jgi:hypothetical protein
MNMRSLLALAAALLAFTPATAFASYYVYCANGRIEVDGREPAQMRSARGSGMCQMGPAFSSLSAAQDFARRNFQSGTCSCR